MPIKFLPRNSLPSKVSSTRRSRWRWFWPWPSNFGPFFLCLPIQRRQSSCRLRTGAGWTCFKKEICDLFFYFLPVFIWGTVAPSWLDEGWRRSPAQAWWPEREINEKRIKSFSSCRNLLTTYSIAWNYPVYHNFWRRKNKRMIFLWRRTRYVHLVSPLHRMNFCADDFVDDRWCLILKAERHEVDKNGKKITSIHFSAHTCASQLAGRQAFDFLRRWYPKHAWFLRRNISELGSFLLRLA